MKPLDKSDRKSSKTANKKLQNIFFVLQYNIKKIFLIIVFLLFYRLSMGDEIAWICSFLCNKCTFNLCAFFYLQKSTL